MIGILRRVFKGQGLRVDGRERQGSNPDDLLNRLGREQLQKLKRKGLSIPVVTV